jgi:hypothetical protein
MCWSLEKEAKLAQSWPKSWPNFSLSSLYSHRNAWANLRLPGHLTPSSLPLGAGTYAGLRAMLAHAAQPAFRARAGGIWDRMMLGQDDASGAG